MSQTINVKLLGGFSLTYDDRPVAGISSGRSQALLAYLVLHGQTPQPRSRVASHLWPESTDAQARANLRKELSNLRHALPNADEFLRVETNMLQWLPHASFSLDTAEFEAAMRAAELATDRSTIQSHLVRAIELYRGDLLSDRYTDEWLLPERERLQQMHLRALEQLVNLLEAQHDYQAALTYAQQMLRIDTLNEAAYVTLMRLHGLNGDRARALQIYHQCMTLLREELGIDPSTSTRKLHEQLLEDETPDSRSHSQALPSFSPMLLSSRQIGPRSRLVGREREWNLMQQWANEIAESQVLLLVGEPGIGKTRLLEELSTLDNVTQVLWGKGFAAEIMRPYGIWIDALRASASSDIEIPTELEFLMPELGRRSQWLPDLPPAQWNDRSHLFDAVVQLLRQWANRSPLLILFDDIQWIDEASSALLHYAVRLLRYSPVLFACTARIRELEDNAAILPAIQALRREQRLQTLEISALDREQTADLMRSTGAIAPLELSLAVVNQVFIDSGGNPLFALEIARSRSQDRSARANNLETLICDRIHQLDDAAREFLPWAAALGRSFKLSTVAQVADYPPTKLLTAIEQLEQRSIIRPSNSLSHEMGYDFAHDIVRQVVYAQLSEPRRQLLHLQIAQKLNQQLQQQRTQDLASDIAHHAALGGDRALAASASVTAADRCLKLFAYAEALELAQQGIEHCQFLDRQTRIPLQVRLLNICAIAGVRGDRAAQIESEIDRLVSEAKLLGLNEAEAIGLEALMILQFNRNNFSGVHKHSLRVAEASQFATPATAALMLAHSGSCLAEIGRDAIRAEALLLEAQSLAARVGLEICDIFSGLGSIHRHNGRYNEARTLLQQACQLAQVQEDHWRECTYFSYLAMLELESDNPVDALPYCDRMVEVATKIEGEGSEVSVASALAALARYRLPQPNAERALEEINRAIATLQQVDAKRMLAYVLIGAAAVDLECDRPELAVNRATIALQNARIVNHPSEIALSWAILVQGLWALGDQNQALAELRELRQNVNYHDLSFLALTAINRAIQAVTPTATETSKKSKFIS
jgi:DNA-binding SARP family transcriptional activator/predicted ATPase